MRAFDTSSQNASRPVQRCMTPGAVALIIDTSEMIFVPSTASITAAAAPALMQCAHGYSGCIGVLSIGCQVASRLVAELASTSPLRIAVIGRHSS
jgi:hypothetical protein